MSGIDFYYSSIFNFILIILFDICNISCKYLIRKYLSSITNKMCNWTIAASVIIIICTLVHAVTCFMVGHSMCAITHRRNLAKVLNIITFAAAIWILVFVAPGIIAKAGKSNKSMVYLLVLMYVLVSVILHSTACILNNPICGIINNEMAVNTHNVLLILCAVYLMACTPFLHN
jgi:hypothetical protein